MEVTRINKTVSNFSKLDLYKSEMEEIAFLAIHMEDFPEIFNIYSEKCKLFLVKTFTVLNTNFHYLSFLGNDSIGQELAKAASILRIYPHNLHQKSNEIFHDMNDMEIHRFWMRFFKLCKINSLYVDLNSMNDKIDSIGKICSIFCDMNKTVQYFNYDISVINPKQLKGLDVNKEIESWIPASFLTSINESSFRNVNQEVTFPEKFEVNGDINKLISDVHYIKKRADFESLSILKLPYPYKEFFISFNHAVQTIKNYIKNINFLSSFIVQDLIKNTNLHKESYWLSSNCQIKRCNNIIQNIVLLKEEV